MAVLSLAAPASSEAPHRAPPSTADDATLAARADSLDAVLDDLLDRYRVAPAYRVAARLFRLRYDAFGPDDPRTLDVMLRLGRLGESSDLTAHGNDFLSLVLPAYRDALGPDHPKVAETRIRLARLWRGGRPDLRKRAEEHLAAAARILAKRDPGPEVRAEYEHALGAQLRLESRVDEALPHYREALRIRRGAFGEHDLRTINNLIWLSWLERRIGENAAAEAGFRHALELLDDMGLPDHPLRVPALDWEAELARAQGRNAAAERLAREAIRVTETARPHQLAPRRGYGLHAYFSLAHLLLERGAKREAWEAVQAGLGPRSRDAVARSEPGPVERALALRLSAAEGTFQARHAAWRRGEDVSHAELVERLVEVAELRSALLPAFEERATVDIAARATTLPPLAADEAYVGWLAVGADLERGENETASWGWVWRGGDDVHWVRLGRWTETAAFQAWMEPARERSTRLARAADWSRSLGPDAELDALSARVARQFVEPLEPWLDGVDRLVILPSWGVPDLGLESLLDEHGTVLGERFAISYASSPDLPARLAARSRARTATAADAEPRPILIVGDPAFDGVDRADDAPSADIASLDDSLLRSVLAGDEGALDRLPRLPFSRREAEGLAALFGERATLLTGTAASERELRALATGDRLRRYGVLHFATHALYDAKFGDRSALALARPDSPELDGLVTLVDIETSWHLDANLVTFSGCETGPAAELESGGGFLVPALAAGARCVLASRWRVHDAATFLFMQRFYGNVAGVEAPPMPPDRALREARHWLRRREEPDGRRPFEHPFYWSGFFLFGEAH